jgi:phosphoribosyl 1,2-cyclic phosphate phosphodiesterase
LKVSFLGTGTSQGVPVIGCECEVCRSLDFRDKRFRASIYVEAQGVSLVIDTGPDFRIQMLRAGIKRLDAVLFTHEHKDHTAGMDDIRPFNYIQQKDMPVFARANVLDQIRREFSYVFSPKRYPGVPQIELIEITETPFHVNGLPVTPIPVLHYKLPVLGFRFGSFSYITDANNIPEESMKLLEGTEVLVLNALQNEPHISHFTLKEAIAVAEKIGARQTFFTHMSHRLGLHAQVDEALPPGMALAYDGLELTLD